ncbi:MAG TPA: GNAT family N-acetyltransferase [Mucilaginibacter sp.]|jgi:ribosomal protein S18 acetylase RimI-like enzyme|nr:GNAT family N-acetyltransferase [Mucilaginibacter sp.]
MDHILNNPGWNALISGNKNFANGGDGAKYFDKDVAPFVGLKDNSAEDFNELHELTQPGEVAIHISPAERDIPGNWKVLNCVKGLQMIYEGPTAPDHDAARITPLTIYHVPQMLALTKLTQPGPFLQRTIEFGHYTGIFDDDRLVAMAGQRLHIFNYAEISAVCTHPDYLGRGYAKQLLLHQATRIIAEGNIPFLHLREDNERAFKVYQSLGFKTRCNIWFYVMQKV